MGGPDGGQLRERAAEITSLSAAVRRVRGGTGGLVVIEGAAGVGKTRLAEAAGALAVKAGCAVLRATGSHLEQRVPFGVAARLLGPPVREADRDERRFLLAGGAKAAGLVLLEDRGAQAAVAEPMTVVHALHWAAANLADRRPLVLVVDDLQWVDPLSLRLVAYLTRNLADRPILQVVATRTDEPAADPGTLRHILAVPGAVTLRPQPLSTAATAALLTDLLPEPPTEPLVRACVEATGGNPLQVEALAHVLEARQHGDEVPPRDAGADAVRRWVSSTLLSVSDAAVALASALAVLEASGADLAGTLAGLSPENERQARTELEANGLLGDASVTHPIVRAAILAGITVQDRERMHADAARLLADRGDLGAAAAHMLELPAPGQPWVADVLERAAVEALSRAVPAEAARLFERALQERLDPPGQQRIIAGLARAQAAAGDSAAAATFARAAAAEPDPEAQARLLLALAWTHQSHGHFAPAVEAAAQGLALDVQDEELRVELAAMHDAAVLWSPAHAPSEARALVGRASGRVRRVALADAARREMFAGEIDHRDAVDMALAAWDGGALLRASVADDPVLVRVLTVLHNADALADALAVAEACLQDASRRASPMAHATWSHLRGHVFLYLGRLDEAEADLAEALAASEFGWGAWLPVTAGALITVRVEQGDLKGAQAALDVAQQAGTHPPDSPMWSNTQAARGRLKLAMGDWEAAVDDLLSAGEWAHRALSAYNPALGPWRADAVLALDALGRTDEARELAGVELAAARRWNAPRAVGLALRVSAQAEVDGRRGALLQEAVDVLADAEPQLEHAHALAALGEHELAMGDPAARERLRVALDLADRSGASALAQRARRQLVAAGGRPRRRRLSGPESLTVSERRVAERAAAGHSTRQIAEELFVTTKAVSFHLGNVYKKLGIPGRRALASALPATTPERGRASAP